MELLGLVAIGLLILFIRSFFRGSSGTASRQLGRINVQSYRRRDGTRVRSHSRRRPRRKS